MARVNTGDDMDDMDGDDISVSADAAESLSSSDAAEMAASREDAPEARSVTSRCRIRDQLNDDIAEFLLRGGAINNVEAHVMADPPRRPNSDYGSRPI